VYIVDETKWSFIEVIGVSDVVITQGMTSSATIALICGIEGLYLDQANYDHPFSRDFKGIAVFEDKDSLLLMIRKILMGDGSVLKNIPEEMMRGFDGFFDDEGIERFRHELGRDSEEGRLKNEKVSIIVQARMTSTRLPGKVMKCVDGKPLLEYQIERLKRVKNADKIIVATTINASDDSIEKLCRRLNVDVFRGSEEDVLSRYYECMKKYGADIIVRITSDCPIIDPAEVDKVIKRFVNANGQLDYVSNSIQRTYPRGMDAEVFSSKALEKAFRETKQSSDREHVTPYMYNNPNKFNIANVSYVRDESRHRWTVDTIEDFMLIEKIINVLYPSNEKFDLKDCLELLDENPSWKDINMHIRQKDLWQ